MMSELSLNSVEKEGDLFSLFVCVCVYACIFFVICLLIIMLEPTLYRHLQTENPIEISHTLTLTHMHPLSHCSDCYLSRKEKTVVSLGLPGETTAMLGV